MRHKRKTLSGVIAALIIALCTWGYDHFTAGQNVVAPVAQIESSQIDPSKVWSRGRAGRAAANATAHFKKHGQEFGFQTEAEYVAAAVAFTTNAPPSVLRNVQRDGDIAFYNPKTAEYAVKTKNGYIRTYFKLDPKIHGFQTNTDYFNAQAKRPANDNAKRK